MERDEFMNENFKRDFPELRKNIIKKKVSTQVMSLLIYRFSHEGLKAKLSLINLLFKSNNKLVIHKSVNVRAHSCDF